MRARFTGGGPLDGDERVIPDDAREWLTPVNIASAAEHAPMALPLAYVDRPLAHHYRVVAMMSEADELFGLFTYHGQCVV